ncbi:unnamed protein product [Urochloa humidicola]
MEGRSRRGGKIVCSGRNRMTGAGTRRRKWDGCCDGEATTMAMAGGNNDGGLRVGGVMVALMSMERDRLLGFKFWASRGC